jgi:hypothetical protein
MKTNNKILGNYLNKPVYRINSKFNEGEYYINFNNVNYTLPKWKQNNPSLRDAIECIHYKHELEIITIEYDKKDLIHLKNGLNKKVINIQENNIDNKEKIKKYKLKLQQENEELDEIEEQIKKLKLMRKEKLNKIEIIENKIIKLKPKKHKMDLQLLPTDIIKNISKHLIQNDDFRLNEIMHGKIDIGLTNFFFNNNNLKVNKYLALYLGPNKYTQYYISSHNLNHYIWLYKHRNKLNMEYALCDSNKVVSYFKIYFEFIEWFEYDERDKYREIFEQRYTKVSYYTYIEAYDKNDNLLSKTKNNMMISKYLKEFTEFKLND